jgi:hypothetical protein
MNGHVEQDGALGNCSDMLPCPVRVEVFDVLIIQRDCTFLCVIHAKEKLGDGGFPRARAANNKGSLGRGKVDRDVLENGEGRA